MGQAKASGARKRGSNRGESQNNREFLRWQADHNELQQLRFQHEQALTNLQNTEGELWALEIQTQALQARANTAEAQLASASATLEAKNHCFASLFEAHRETTTRAKSLQHQLTITTEALARTNAEKLKIMEDIIQKNDRHLNEKETWQETERALKNELDRKQKAWDQKEKAIKEDFENYKARQGLFVPSCSWHISVRHRL